MCIRDSHVTFPLLMSAGEQDPDRTGSWSRGTIFEHVGDQHEDPQSPEWSGAWPSGSIHRISPRDLQLSSTFWRQQGNITLPGYCCLCLTLGSLALRNYLLWVVADGKRLLDNVVLSWSQVLVAVSYTHLDVYKRQLYLLSFFFIWLSLQVYCFGTWGYYLILYLTREG